MKADKINLKHCNDTHLEPEMKIYVCAVSELFHNEMDIRGLWIWLIVDLMNVSNNVFVFLSFDSASVHLSW